MVDSEQLYRQGVAAIRQGDRGRGRALLEQVVQQNQMHEQAWLWLSAVVEERDEKLVCLENVLTINPTSTAARRGLRALGVEVPELPVVRPPEPEIDLMAGVEEVPDIPNSPLLQHAGVKTLEEGFRLPQGLEAERRARDRDRVYESLIPPGHEYVSSATLVPQEVERPKRSLNDLVEVWLAAIIFRHDESYETQIRYGPFLHILVSLSASLVFQGLAGAIPLVVFTLQPQTLDHFIASLNSLAGQIAGLTPWAALSGDFEGIRQGLRYLLGPDAVPAISGAPALSGAVVLGALPVIALIYLFYLFLFSFLGTMYQAWVTDRVAYILQGKGDVFQTFQALTLVMAVSSLLRIPLAVAAPILPVVVLIYLSILANLHQFAMTAFAVGKAHRMGWFLAAGVVILSGGVTVITGGLMLFVLNLLMNLILGV